LRGDRPDFPQLVISVGGALVSRMLKEYLRTIPDKDDLMHWSVGYNHTTIDCFKCLTATIVCDPGLFISRLSAEMAHIIKTRGYQSLASGYAEKINSDRSQAITRIDREIEGCRWCEAKAFKSILELIPHKDNVCISNGTSIRYTQLFTRRLQHAQYCNRGVSGIDGSTSTAVGISLGYKGKTWLITGDMSLTYDTNGLDAARQLDPRLNIVVINNRGGGIFRFIKSSRDLEIREKMLSGGDLPSVPGYAQLYDFDYYRAECESDLEKALTDIIMTGRRSLLEIVCDPEYSASVLCGLLRPRK
ncbi:MAG: hypothetical protein K2H86_07940, partial [Muribaculaceae bacterium]|nr:hypothetical protein [Muribaculaceae bacterium]